jgi:hypothetical protein
MLPLLFSLGRTLGLGLIGFESESKDAIDAKGEIENLLRTPSKNEMGILAFVYMVSLERSIEASMSTLMTDWRTYNLQ